VINNRTGDLTTKGNISSSSTTASSSTSTGSLVVAGGTGISGNAYVGGNVNISSSTSSSSNTTGALVVSGGVGKSNGLNVNSKSNFSNSLSCGSLSTASASITALTNLKFINMYNITVTGYSNNSSGTITHSWAPSQGTTLSANNFSFSLPTGCISMCSQYSYYTVGTYAFQGITI